MPTFDAVLEGVAAAMEAAVPDLTTALSREADPADNAVEFPHGEIVVVDNPRATAWNTDLVGYETDNAGNRTAAIYDAIFEPELQLNVWLPVPNASHDVQGLGSQLERALRVYDDQQQGEPLPDGNGGTLSDVDSVRVAAGGTLPTEPGQSSPLRGYQIGLELAFRDQTTADGTPIETIDVPAPSDLGDGGDGDDVAIEYNA